MIPLVCDCGAKFKVKDEFAGKAFRCAHCQSPIRVPSPEPRAMMDFVPEFEDLPEGRNRRSTRAPHGSPKPRRGYGALRALATLNRGAAWLAILFPIAAFAIAAMAQGPPSGEAIALVVASPFAAFFWYLGFRSSGELFDLTANVAEDIQEIRERGERA